MTEIRNVNAVDPVLKEQIELLRRTFAQIESSSELAAFLFYGRLFEIAPDVRPLFKTDLDAQGKKLMQMIAVAVAHLDNLSAITPAIKALGERHTAYGVKPADYHSVGEALLWTLEQGLGDAFTPEVRDAWSKFFTTVAGTMQHAADVSKS